MKTIIREMTKTTKIGNAENHKRKDEKTKKHWEKTKS